MASHPRKLTTLTLALAGALCFVGQALAQTNVTLTPSTARIDHVTNPGTTTKEYDPTVTATSNGAPITGLTLTTAVTQQSTVGTAQWLKTGTPQTNTQPNAPAGSYIVPIIFDPSGLTSGVYNGRVDISAPGTTGSTAIQVSLTVTAPNSLTVAPTSLTFTYQAGSGIAPQPQTLNIQPNGAPFQFTAATFLNNPTTLNFLAVSPQSGTASATEPTPLTVSVVQNIAQGLPVGTYTGTVRVASSSTTTPNVDVPVTVNVVNSPSVSFSNQSLTFNVTPNSTTPVTQTLFFANSGAGLPYTVSVTNPNNLSILSASPTSGTTPGAVVVSVNPAGLAPGTYTGTVQVAVQGALNSQQNIPVTINVSSNAQISPSQSQVNFAYQTGTSIFPAAQTITLNSTLPNTPLSYQVAVTGGQVSGQSFLSVTPSSGTTPSNLTISLNQSVIQNLTPGTYTATIQVTSSNQTSPFATLLIPVVLTVSQNAQLTVNPSAMSFNYQTFTAPPAAQTITVGTTGTPLSFSVAVTQPANVPSSNTSVINVVPTTGSVSSSQPASVSVSINPQFLTDGVYTGSITITSAQAGNSPVIVPITVTVTTSATLTIGPGPFPLVFRQIAGGSAPAAQNITLASSGVPLNYSITTNVLNSTGCSNFQLLASPSTGIASSGAGTSVAISVAGTAAIPANTTCTGSLIVTSSVPGSTTSSTQIVPVTFTVSPSATLSLASQTANFTFTIGGTAPQSQKIAITASNNAVVPVTVATSVSSPAGGNWLQASLDSQNTPANVTISVNPANLAAGTYNGTVTVTSAGASNSPQTINVTLVVSAVAVGNITGLSNAASYQTGTISPGEIVSIFGANIGPTTPAGLTAALIANGSVPTTLGGVTVTFDGIAAPVTYASSTQVNVVVPYEIAGRATTTVQINNSGVTSNTLQFRVADAAPGIFSANASGTGSAAALNQDNTPNNSANRAARNSVVQLFATGEGQTNPVGQTGKIAGSTPLPRPVLPVLVRFGGPNGIIANVEYAGVAPGLVSGVLQVNARVPASVTPNPDGSVQVEINIGGTVQNGQIVGGTFAQSGVVVYVQ